MDRPGPAKDEKRVRPDVLAAFDPVDSRGRGHVFADHTMDSPSGRGEVESERTTDSFFDSAARCIGVQTHLPAEEEIGIEISEHEVRVGHGWLGATQAVAGRSGTRAC